MNYATVCSGIEAPSVAWEPLGWKPVFFSEIEKFPSEVLRYHWPDVPNYGDMTKFKEWPKHELELICGGTPCQSFSVAGLRKGLDDPRGNLTLTYLGVIDRYRPRWVVWENVPGVLSADGGKAFGAFLGGLAQLGYGFAYRVLDAQYFGVPQRRRRVFVVGYLGDWRAPAAVLFERHSLSGHTAPGREAGQGTAGGFAIGPSGGHRCDIAPTLDARAKDGPIRNQVGLAVFKPQNHGEEGGGYVPAAITNALDAQRGSKQTHLVMAHGQGNAEVCRDGEPSLTCNHEVPIVINNDRGAFMGQNGPIHSEDCAFTLNAQDRQAVAMRMREGCEGGGKGPLLSPDSSLTLASGNDQTIFHNTTVRRLTPRECERLQGFPDDFTRIPWRGKDAENCPDGPRYKALGNSMAVPVVRWIGERIEAVRKILTTSK